MPFYHFYGESGEEDDVGDGESNVPGAFEYDTVSAKFNAGALQGVPAAALEMVLAAGVTEMRVRYDGGNDEGFAHADDMWINGDRKFLDDIIDAIATPMNVDAIRIAAEAEPNSSVWGDGARHYRNREPRNVIADALDDLAHEIASQLLGQGYGTGEYELYGAVTMIFETGEMIDDPAAERPLDRM
jgi:hypothetical protein